eukprot:TRINITY_DN67602_c10_g14_i1.p1 TRINITY_DN67602_c10_g14~~TRINITY_DN67602_c10_g14_i1.p1  ORF type:complete len:407 (-),score=16.40 TRINITY_DN67602_c10_g14_i1:586-1632(-)
MKDVSFSGDLDDSLRSRAASPNSSGYHKIASRVERTITRPILIDFSFCEISAPRDILTKAPRNKLTKNPEPMPDTVARPRPKWVAGEMEPDELAKTPRVISAMAVKLSEMKEWIPPDAEDWPLYAIYPEGQGPQVESSTDSEDDLLEDESEKKERRAKKVAASQGGGLHGNYGIRGKYVAVGLKLSNNNIKSWDGWNSSLAILINDFLHSLTYLDLSSNQLAHIPKEFGLFTAMNRLYLHGNNFTNLNEVKRLVPLSGTVSVLTLHANKIAEKKSYKKLILSIFPYLKTLDKSTITTVDYTSVNLVPVADQQITALPTTTGLPTAPMLGGVSSPTSVASPRSFAPPSP